MQSKKNTPHKSAVRLSKDQTSYLEIYIEESGRIIMTPVTSGTEAVVKTFSCGAFRAAGNLCG